MRFSIITPSYLGDYRNAGKDRPRKLRRAINSVMLQNTNLEFEQIVVADGCPLTAEIIKSEFKQELSDGILRLIEIPKQKNFSGVPRNTGINAAKGEWICYLDNDDILGGDHLEILNRHVNGFDWVFFNDLVSDGKQFIERYCYFRPYQCGTSNIAHRRSMRSRWKERNSYGTDDWQFINILKNESKNYATIKTPEYVVCHIPLRGGYDI